MPHIIFLDELRRHSDREVCLGAAEYAANRDGWVFDPWPVSYAPAAAPGVADLRLVQGILTTERAMGEIAGLKRRVKLPLVYCLADRAHASADAVGIDEEAVGAMAAEHLWDRGYRAFAFVGSSTEGWSQTRCFGFEQWLSERNATPQIRQFRPDQLPVYWSWNVARRHQHLQQMLAELPRPCGIFAANDVIACFVLQAARHSGHRAPGVFGVLGVDNDPFPNAAAGMAISSIELPFREVGRQAARLVHERLEGADPGRELRLAPIRVVVRASTDVFMTQHPLVRQAQAYIESRRHERLTVGAVTRAVGSNRVTLGKHFQQELGATLSDYVRHRRLAYAVESLRRGEATVDEIASRCGFSSTSYFSRVLKAETGRRPGAWKKLKR